MAKNYNEQVSEMSKCYIEPLLALTELNTKTFNKVTKNTHIENFVNAKEASDIFEAQRELVNTINAAAMNYAQELTNLMLETSSNLTKQFTHMSSEFSQKAGEFSQKGSEAFKSSAQNFKASSEKK